MNAAVEMIPLPNAGSVSHESSERERYARCVKASKRVRWDIDTDVFRGRSFDFTRKFLPDGLTKVHALEFLTEQEKCTMSQVQGRTYACMFGLVERFIGAKTLQLACAQGLGDQLVLEGLLRFSDEELKHQELFRRIEAVIAQKMPGGYAFIADPDEIARAVLRNSTWAVLALTCHIELFTQAHYRESLEGDQNLSDLYRDVFRFHWLEECQHTIMDEIEWGREDRVSTACQRDRALEDLIELLLMLDTILQAQSSSDAAYFMRLCERSFNAEQQRAIRSTVLRAYRWQYIASGAQHPRFVELLSSMVTNEQMQRMQAALKPLLE